MQKLCATCKHYEKQFFEEPCKQCLLARGRRYWEPEYNDNPYWQRITAIAEKQRAKGMSKYGQGLEANPADILERINHLQEELIDGLMYCEWIKEWVQETMKNAFED